MFQANLDSVKKNPFPEGLSDWLTYRGSFMQRLKQHGITDAKIKILYHRWDLPSSEERTLLNLPFRTYGLIREVLIYSENTHWMLARTIIPRPVLVGKLKQLAHLRCKSLGSILFRCPTMQRSPFEFSYLPVAQDVFAATIVATNGWARRSAFGLGAKQLLLTEVFLPGMKQLCKKE